MDILVTKNNKDEIKVILITPDTPYKEIKDEISLSEFHTFTYGRKSIDFNKMVCGVSRKFSALTEMLQEINKEGKLNQDQRNTFNDFKEAFDKFIDLF